MLHHTEKFERGSLGGGRISAYADHQQNSERLHIYRIVLLKIATGLCRENEIGKLGADAIGRMLMTSRCLREIDISWNNIRGDGAHVRKPFSITNTLSSAGLTLDAAFPLPYPLKSPPSHFSRGAPPLPFLPWSLSHVIPSPFILCVIQPLETLCAMKVSSMSCDRPFKISTDPEVCDIWRLLMPRACAVPLP